MRPRPLPILWLTGPPGVGKTTVAREVWRRLRQRGRIAAYVSIDQLGMCFPAPDTDPHRHAVKAANLGAVVPGFVAAGAQCLVMCGVADPQRVADQAAGVPGARVVLGRLGLRGQELRLRLAARGWADELVAEALTEAKRFERSGAGDFEVDCDGLSVAEVTDRVLGHRGELLDGPVDAPAAIEPVSQPGSILWLCGTTAVGKSTIAWDVFMNLLRGGDTAALIDLEQIGGLPDGRDADPGNHVLKARNLAAMWRTYHARGARRLVINGPLERPEHERPYRQALPNAEFTVVRLDAGRERLLDRMRQRAHGDGWRIPGDELLGKGSAELEAIAERAVADAERAKAAGVGHVVIGTDGRDGADIARDAMAAAKWPQPTG